MKLSDKSLFERWKRENQQEVNGLIGRMEKEGLGKKDIDFNLKSIFLLRQG